MSRKPLPGWSPVGRVPTWREQGGPARSVKIYVNRQIRRGYGMVWSIAADHVETVWGVCYRGSERYGLSPDPLEFGALIARHFFSCRECQQDQYTALWGVVLRYVGLTDIIEAIRQGQQEDEG